MGKSRLAAALVLVAAVTAGCGAVVDGVARPAPNLKPHPVIGAPVKQLPLDAAALSQLLGRPFAPVSQFPPVFGGADLLDDAYPSASPPECTGVVYMTQKSVYRSATVANVATELWQQEGNAPTSTDVAESVVAVPTMTDATALFAGFSDQWKQCDGKTLTTQSSNFVDNAIADVGVADSVVSAHVLKGFGAQSILHAVPEVRALGVRGNCLVEIEVAYVGSGESSDQPPAKTDAVAVAHAVMDRISARSAGG
ncbi:hypothetical protein A5647_21830 [Mycobacterium sp. 1100029.7]|nr:hypothetical protein A5647_21830 [Mycobacterium sp. 1100029.7]